MDPEDPYPRLEELLRGLVPLPRATRALRRRVRQTLFGQEKKSTSQDPEEARTGGRLKFRLEQKMATEPLAPPADERFRAALRERFVEGTRDELPAGPGVGDVLVPSPSEPRREGQGTAWREGRLLRLLLPVAAAAAILFVAFLPRDPTWNVEFRGDGPVTLDGASFPPSENRRLGAALSRSGTLNSGENTLTLRLDAGLEVRVLPGTQVALADLPPLDGSQTIFLSLHSGEFYLRTTPGYPGNNIRIVTDLGDVEVHGTTLGVKRGEEGFCVCVSEGIVGVRNERDDESRWLQVEQGKRFYIPENPRVAAAIVAQEPDDAHSDGLRRYADGTSEL